MIKLRRLLPLTALVLLPAISPAKDKKKDPDEIGNRDVAKGINFYSIEKEIALGKQLALEVEKQAKMVDDPILGEYVNRLGQNLGRNSDAKIPLKFKIIDSDSINAFTLPGGFIFVNSGLIRVAETEAELAGVIAHEIAHSAARHMTRQQTRAEIVNMATVPLIFMGGWWGYAARQGANVGIPLGFLSFSRAFESEADLLGLEYMYKTGYDPTASVDIFERIESLEKRRPGTMARMFSSHPMTADRIRMAQKNIAEILPNKANYVVNTSGFNEMRERMVAQHRRSKREAAAEPVAQPSDQGRDDTPVLRRRED